MKRDRGLSRENGGDGNRSGQMERARIDRVDCHQRVVCESESTTSGRCQDERGFTCSRRQNNGRRIMEHVRRTIWNASGQEKTSEPRWSHLRFDHLFVYTATQTQPLSLSGSAIFSDNYIDRDVCSVNCNKDRPTWTETEGMFARQQACETKSYNAIQYNTCATIS